MNAIARTARAIAAPNDSLSQELKQILRTLKLGKMLDTLPERLALASTQQSQVASAGAVGGQAVSALWRPWQGDVP